MYLTLVPAYGRDYKSAKAVKADFDANKDFVVADFDSPYDGKSVNKADLLKAGGVKAVNIRYKKLANLTVVKLAS